MAKERITKKEVLAKFRLAKEKKRECLASLERINRFAVYEVGQCGK